jgi:hemerythrin-like domain-containing protein
MAMRSPTEVLRDEHCVILGALLSLEQAGERLSAGGALPEGLWTRLIAWLRDFVDRNHHAKEEDALFPAMVHAGVPAGGGPIDVMLEEHAEGRDLLRAMETGTAAERAAAARRYVDLLRDHIDKENALLFPLADAVLDAEAQAALLRQFVGAEAGAAMVTAGAEAGADRLAAALAVACRRSTV